MKVCLLLFVFLISSLAIGQECVSVFKPKKMLPAQTSLCPEAMRADLEQLHKHILETHPNPTYYTNPTALSTAYQQARAACMSPKTVIEFMQIINAYLSVMKDSHSGINSKEFLYAVNGSRQVLPFFVEEIDAHYYLSSIYNGQLKSGTELLAIDNYSLPQLAALSTSLSMCEGNSEKAKAEIAADHIGVMYNLLAMRQEKHSANFKIRTEAGDTTQVAVESLSSRRYFLSSLSFRNEETWYYFDSLNHGVLVLETFQPVNLELFKRKVDHFFEEVQKRNCQYVVIDLRNNLGGLLRAQEYVFSYINSSSEAIKMNYLYKRSDYDRFALLSPFQLMQFENRAKNVYPNGLISQEFDFYRLPKGALRTILYDYVPTNNLDYTYKGTCSLVINGSSMSASVLFAAWFKHINRGLVLGTPCMGGMGGTFGNPALIQLQHSNMSVIVSTLKFTPFHVKEVVLDGIEPDVWLNRTKKQIEQHIDPLDDYLKLH